MDYKNKSVEVDGELVRLQVWDTAGQERFRNIAPGACRLQCLRVSADPGHHLPALTGLTALAPLPCPAVYFRGSDGLMLVFNVNDESSFGAHGGPAPPRVWSTGATGVAAAAAAAAAVWLFCCCYCYVTALLPPGGVFRECPGVDDADGEARRESFRAEGAGGQ